LLQKSHLDWHSPAVGRGGRATSSATLETTCRLVERADVVAAAERLVERARAGQGGALFVVGEPGLGKTTVLAHACAVASGLGVVVGLGRANAMEASLPYGLVAEAFASAGGEDLLDGVAIGGPSNDVRAARFYAALRWLRRADVGPTFLAFDDLHWADPDSLALVSFLGRRLGQLPVAVIAT